MHFTICWSSKLSVIFSILSNGKSCRNPMKLINSTSLAFRSYLIIILLAVNYYKNHSNWGRWCKKYASSILLKLFCCVNQSHPPFWSYSYKDRSIPVLRFCNKCKRGYKASWVNFDFRHYICPFTYLLITLMKDTP